MQYILTKEELDRLTPKGEVDKRDQALVMARQRILAISEFPCVHETPSRNDYCDRCPCSWHQVVGGVSLTYEQSKLLCGLPRNYSK